MNIMHMVTLLYCANISGYFVVLGVQFQWFEKIIDGEFHKFHWFYAIILCMDAQGWWLVPSFIRKLSLL